MVGLISLAGCGGAESRSESDVATTATTTAAAEQTYVQFSGSTQPVSRPLRIDNGNSPIENVSWEEWGGRSASGTGELGTSDCVPNCAEGAVTYARVAVTLSKPASCSGRRYYTSGELVQDGKSYPLQVLDCASLSQEVAPSEPESAADVEQDVAPPEPESAADAGGQTTESPYADASEPVVKCRVTPPVIRLKASRGIGCMHGLETALEAAGSKFCTAETSKPCAPTVDDVAGQIAGLACTVKRTADGRAFSCSRAVPAARAAIESLEFETQD